MGSEMGSGRKASTPKVTEKTNATETPDGKSRTPVSGTKNMRRLFGGSSDSPSPVKTPDASGTSLFGSMFLLERLQRRVSKREPTAETDIDSASKGNNPVKEKKVPLSTVETPTDSVVPAVEKETSSSSSIEMPPGPVSLVTPQIEEKPVSSPIVDASLLVPPTLLDTGGLSNATPLRPQDTFSPVVEKKGRVKDKRGIVPPPPRSYDLGNGRLRGIVASSRTDRMGDSSLSIVEEEGVLPSKEKRESKKGPGEIDKDSPLFQGLEYAERKPDKAALEKLPENIQAQLEFIDKLSFCASWFCKTMYRLDDNRAQSFVDKAALDVTRKVLADSKYDKFREDYFPNGESGTPVERLLIALDPSDLVKLQSLQQRFDNPYEKIPLKSELFSSNDIFQKYGFQYEQQKDLHQAYHDAWIRNMCAQRYPLDENSDTYARQLQQRFKGKKLEDLSDLDYQQAMFLEHGPVGFYSVPSGERVALTLDIMKDYLQPSSSENPPYSLSFSGFTHSENDKARLTIQNIRKELAGDGPDWDVNSEGFKAIVDKHINIFYEYADRMHSVSILSDLADRKSLLFIRNLNKEEEMLFQNLGEKLMGCSDLESQDAKNIANFYANADLKDSAYWKRQYIVPQRIMQMRGMHVDEAARKGYCEDFGLSEEESREFCNLLEQFNSFDDDRWNKVKENPLYVARVFNYKMMGAEYFEQKSLYGDTSSISGVLDPMSGGGAGTLSGNLREWQTAWELHQASALNLNLPYYPKSELFTDRRSTPPRPFPTPSRPFPTPLRTHPQSLDAVVATQYVDVPEDEEGE